MYTVSVSSTFPQVWCEGYWWKKPIDVYERSGTSASLYIFHYCQSSSLIASYLDISLMRRSNGLWKQTSLLFGRETKEEVRNWNHRRIALLLSGTLLAWFSENLKSEIFLPTFLLFNLSDHRDEAQLNKLQQLGMTPSEEVKLLAMRDYIWKFSQAISRCVEGQSHKFLLNRPTVLLLVSA